MIMKNKEKIGTQVDIATYSTKSHNKTRIESCKFA
jgi:hypothetical protein